MNFFRVFDLDDIRNVQKAFSRYRVMVKVQRVPAHGPTTMEARPPVDARPRH
jgi:hypothetical protein